MPNWCSNRLTVRGPMTDLETFIEAVNNPEPGEDEAEWDITRPYPMPAILEGTRSPAQTGKELDDHIARLLKRRDAGETEVNKGHPDYPGSWVTEKYLEELRAMGEKSEKALAETGYADWYGWRSDHWSVKWAPRIDPHSVTLLHPLLTLGFDSPWGPPERLILKLSSLYPTLTFVIEYSEPGMAFLGADAFKDGECLASFYTDAEADPILESLHNRINALYENPDAPDFGDEEEQIHEDIDKRWIELANRAGTDVAQAAADF